MSETDDIGARILFVDVGVRSLLIGEARRRALTRVFGVPPEEQSLAGHAASCSARPARSSGAWRRPLPRPSRVDGAGGATVAQDDAARHRGSAGGRRVPAAGGLIAFALLSHSAAPHGGREPFTRPGRSCTASGRRSACATGADRPGARPRGARTAGSGSQPPVVLAVDEDAVDDVDAQEEDRQRPPRVGAADRQQRPDRTEAGADDPDDPADRCCRPSARSPRRAGSPRGRSAPIPWC